MLYPIRQLKTIFIWNNTYSCCAFYANQQLSHRYITILFFPIVIINLRQEITLTVKKAEKVNTGTRSHYWAYLACKHEKVSKHTWKKPSILNISNHWQKDYISKYYWTSNSKIKSHKAHWIALLLNQPVITEVMLLNILPATVK